MKTVFRIIGIPIRVFLAILLTLAMCLVACLMPDALDEIPEFWHFAFYGDRKTSW